MPKCPECGEKIDVLENFCTVSERYEFDGIDYSSLLSSESTCDETEFACPECGETLFTDEEEATEFLKGRKTKKTRGSKLDKMERLKDLLDELRDLMLLNTRDFTEDDMDEHLEDIDEVWEEADDLIDSLLG